MVVLVQTMKAGGLGGLDALDGFAENALALDADIVGLFQSIEMDVEEETLVGGEFAAGASR